MPKKNKQGENLKTTKQDNEDVKPKKGRGHPKNESKREQAGTRRNQTKDNRPTSNLDSMESVKGRGKFRQRVLESNWAKYEEEPVSDEEFSINKSERPTTNDFCSLISQSGKEISSFRFKEEHEFETDQDTQQKLGASEEILSINLNSLSNSLKDIPIYKKLSLQHTFDMLNEKGLQWHGEYFQSLRETKRENLTVETNEQESHETVEWRFDDNDIKTNIKQLLGKMRIKQKSTHNECEDKNKLQGDKSARSFETLKSMMPQAVVENNAESKASVLMNEDIMTAANRTGINSMIPQQTSSNLENAEDELEVLLSMIKAESKSKDKKKPSNMHDSCRDSSERSAVQNEVRDKNSELESTQSNAKEDVAELEDWLDSMLE